MGRDGYTSSHIPEQYKVEGRIHVDSIDDVLRLERDAPFIKKLDEFEMQVGKPFEAVPFGQKERLLLERLDEIVKILRVNPAWRTRLDDVGVEGVDSLSDWHRVPITTRDDLHHLYTRTKDGLVVSWGYEADHSGHKVIASGGSSGEPVLTMYRTRELQDIGKRAGNFWRRQVIGQDSGNVTFLNLFDNKNGWASNELVQNILEGIPGSNTIPAGTITLPRVADFFLRQGVTDIAGLPSNFSQLVHFIEDEYPGASFPEVLRATYGGEFMDPVILDQLQRVFPNIQLVSVYSSTQVDHMAVQVGSEADHLRMTDDINFLEIVDEEGLPVPDGAVGRIIATRLMGNGDQALRVDLQDKGSILLPDIDDPLQARKLQLLGREGDYLRVSTWDIRAGDLLHTSHRVLSEVLPVEGIQARQLVVDEVGVHLKLAVSDPIRYPMLDRDVQFDFMHRAIMQATGFFEDPYGFPRIELTIEFVTISDLARTSAGKIHPFVNKRREDKK